MDINELLGRATKTIGKIKGVGNDSTSELVTKAKSAVANIKPRPKKPVVTNEPKVDNTTIGNPDLKVDTIVNETVGEKLAQNGAGHVANIGMAAAPKAIGDAAIEKMIDKKYPDANDKPEMSPGNMAEHDEDVENIIELMGTMAMSEATAAKALMPLAERLIAKVAGKKVAPEVIESIMAKWFKNKNLNTKELPSQADLWLTATEAMDDDIVTSAASKFYKNKEAPIKEALDTAYERGFGSSNWLEKVVKDYFENNKSFDGLDDYISSNHPNLIREVSKKSAE